MRKLLLLLILLAAPAALASTIGVQILSYGGGGGAPGLAAELRGTAAVVSTTPGGTFVLAASTASYALGFASDSAFSQTGDDPEICYNSGRGDTTRFVMQAVGAATRTDASGNTVVAIAWGGKAGPGVTGSDLLPGSENEFTISNSTNPVPFQGLVLADLADGGCLGLLVTALAGVDIQLQDVHIVLHADTGGIAGGGGTDSQIVYSVDGGTGVDIYTYKAIPTTGTLYIQKQERTVPASSPNIKLGDVDFPWGYQFGCGPSGGGLWEQTDCIQAWYFNIVDSSQTQRVNPYIPAYNHVIENTYNHTGGTNGEMWLEHNSSMLFPIIDVTVTGVVGGTFTVGNYVIVNAWGSGDESWALIVTAAGGDLRLIFQGTLVTPGVGDVVTEVDAMPPRTPTGVTATWPALGAVTPIYGDALFRYDADIFSAAGTSFSKSFSVPMDLADLAGGRLRTFWTGRHSSGNAGAAVNHSGQPKQGLNVGGTVWVYPDTDSVAPFNTNGGLGLQADNGGITYILGQNQESGSSPQTVRVATANGGGSALAPMGRYANITGIGYLYKSQGVPGLWDTGDEICEWAAKGSECSIVIDFGQANDVSTHRTCAVAIPLDNWALVSCYEDGV